MTSFDASAHYNGSRLKLTVPMYCGFLSDLFRKVPLRCIVPKCGFSLESPKVNILIHGGHHYDAGKVFSRHFPYAPIFGGLRQ